MKTPIYSGIFQSDLDASGYKLTGLHLPLVGSDAATKDYVDAHPGGGGGGINLNWINVKSEPYNAVGDGVADDTTAIQGAINAAAAANGGTVYFPLGTYLCNGAFDGTTNSILKIPSSTASPNSPAIVLLGERQPIAGAPVITSTKTGTGTVPTLLASGPSYGGAILSNPQINFTMLYISNLVFVLPPNPTIGAVRLENIAWATVEDCYFEPSGTISSWDVQPTHGTVALWMPNSGNGGQNWCNRVTIIGHDTAFKVGEHFRAPFISAERCLTGIEFLAANEASWANLETYQLATDIRFTGYHPVELFLDLEHAGAGQWYSPTTNIDSLSSLNYGKGEIRYHQVLSDVGPVAGPLTVNGGAYLTFTDLYTMQTTIAPNGYMSTPTLYIGTDLRLVSLTGGGKLQARNHGTGVWADVDQWTNP